MAGLWHRLHQAAHGSLGCPWQGWPGWPCPLCNSSPTAPPPHSEPFLDVLPFPAGLAGALTSPPRCQPDARREAGRVLPDFSLRLGPPSPLRPSHKFHGRPHCGMGWQHCAQALGLAVSSCPKLRLCEAVVMHRKRNPRPPLPEAHSYTPAKYVHWGAWLTCCRPFTSLCAHAHTHTSLFR